jgi:hypothetical protein
MIKVFYIIPRSTGTAISLAVLIIIIFIIGIITRGASTIDRIIPMALFAGVIILHGYFLYSSRRTMFTLSEQGLVVSRTMYGRSIATSDLITSKARVLDLTRDTEYRAKWRTNGVGLPDFALGWFKLRNKEKALMFVTDKHKVVYIPTRSGFSVLLSTPSPEMFLKTLQETIKG